MCINTALSPPVGSEHLELVSLWQLRSTEIMAVDLSNVGEVTHRLCHQQGPGSPAWWLQRGPAATENLGINAMLLDLSVPINF